MWWITRSIWFSFFKIDYFLWWCEGHGKVKQNVEVSQVLQVPRHISLLHNQHPPAQPHTCSPCRTDIDGSLSPRFVAFIRIWWWALYGFGQMYDMSPCFAIMQDGFTALRILCAFSVHPLPQPLTTTDPFSVSIVLPFLECWNYTVKCIAF
jgi:hypothetical protein